MTAIDGKVPAGDLATLWDQHRFDMKLVSPANKPAYKIIVVGTGLAGASAAATLSEAGYEVVSFCMQDSPRRAHSIAAQGGINAAKNYPNDGDTVFRLFYDTVKGGDYRSREANVYRLAQVANNIIDQCVAQGVPFARDYGGYLDNRSFGGAQVSRTFYARSQTGQQLLLGAYSALMKQVGRGRLTIHARKEMVDLVVVDGVARGIVVRDLVTGEFSRHAAHAVVLATGGYSNVFYLSTNAMASNCSAAWRAYKKGAWFANPCFTQIHPTCIPRSGHHQAKLTLMSESLRNDGRVWVPARAGDTRPPEQIPEAERDYYLERLYPSFGNLVPRDVASRNAKNRCDEGHGVGATGQAVYLDFRDAISRLGRQVIDEKYGNIFTMYQQITSEDPYNTPMKIYPASHYTMGGLWVDYNLMSNLPGLFVIGEANFSDHGANRLGASALMQGLADGYFIAPYTITNYLARTGHGPLDTSSAEFERDESRARDYYASLVGKSESTVEAVHHALGQVMWDKVGMVRSSASLNEALEAMPGLLAAASDIRVPGRAEDLNEQLERAARLRDYVELGDLMARDALARNESCGAHFRTEYQTPEHEARRDDAAFQHVAVWAHRDGQAPARFEEPLTFSAVTPETRSYR
ncbi:MAG: fumarate reductase/succinate dehydrogenase flavoprotein subunit [Pseudomonadota bacterium]